MLYKIFFDRVYMYISEWIDVERKDIGYEEWYYDDV